MNRPYTQDQVFHIEMNTEVIAERLSRAGHGPWTRIDEETLEAILYDGMIALREAMLEEEE